MVSGRAASIATIVVTVAVLDQVTKTAALLALQPYVPVEVMPFFNLRLGFNTGISFGVFASDENFYRLPLIVLSFVVGLILVFFAMRAPLPERGALSVIVGGAAGNLTDRILHGRVTDFIDLHAGGWHWPAFNLADVAITLGVVSLLWETFRGDGFMEGKR